VFSDNFTQDSTLNANLWQVNGSVGVLFAMDNCGSCANVTLAPTFSAAGMEIAQITGSAEIGTIQTVASFTPPFTVTATVEGTVSNGHPFVFGISSGDATKGVQITGNLNPDDCSAEANCGNPNTCGTPANPSISANQCYYGIYAKVGTGSGSWPKTPLLDLTPSVGIVYSLEIAVDGSGNSQYTVAEGSQVLGTGTSQIGTGPFYLILAQSEGAPVPGPGPNTAYWQAVSMTPTATVSSPSSSSPAPFDWLLVGIAIAAAAVLIIAIVVWGRRRRGFTVTVLDSASLGPVPGAGVAADGPSPLSGSTTGNGRVAFGTVRSGDYAVKAAAAGYRPSAPVTVTVKGSTEHTVRLERIAPVPPTGAMPAVPSTPAPVVEKPGVAPAAPAEVEIGEGWAGERIRENVQKFREKGALSPETARTAEELGLSRMFVRIMKRRRGRTRVFVEANGRYYLDENALREMEGPGRP